jgi:RNA polymerase sigma-70 factor (ECF subfamily)
VSRSALGQETKQQQQRFDSLFEAHHAEIYRYCVRRLGRTDGEDAAAEVFAVVWRRFDQVREDETKAWLYAVAFKVVGNQYRSRRRRIALSRRLEAFRTEDPGPQDEHAGMSEETHRLYAALDSLPRGDRELLRLASWDGLSRNEIAAVLGIKENAVDQRLYRARSRLKIRFDRLGQESARIETRKAS